VEAQVLKTALESSGIEAFIPEEHIGTINPGVSGVHVRVQVRESQVDDAKALVLDTQNSSRSTEKLENETAKCKVCGNTGVRTSPVGVKGYFLFVLCALIMIPMKSHQSKVCAHCGNKISD